MKNLASCQVLYGYISAFIFGFIVSSYFLSMGIDARCFFKPSDPVRLLPGQCVRINVLYLWVHIEYVRAEDTKLILEVDDGKTGTEYFPYT